jgi:hypothetical protein
LEGGEGAYSDTCSVSAYRLDHGLGHLHRKSGPLPHRATPSIGSSIRDILDELIYEITIGSMNFNNIKACLNGILGRPFIVSDILLNLLVG